jgi:hypothetical protein
MAGSKWLQIVAGRRKSCILDHSPAFNFSRIHHAAYHKPITAGTQSRSDGARRIAFTKPVQQYAWFCDGDGME